MRVLDACAGRLTATKAFADRGHEVISIEKYPQPGYEPTIGRDLREIPLGYLTEKYGAFDFSWGSPPCTCFSQAGISHHFEKIGERSYRPRHSGAVEAMELVSATRQLLEELGAPFIIENPRSMLRWLPMLRDLPRKTIWYCKYGDTRAKPTDLWLGNGADQIFTFLPECKNKRKGTETFCHHEPAPRGAKTGTQGKDNAAERSEVAYGLSLDLCLQMERYMKEVA